MGLKNDNKRNVGPFPSDETFDKACGQFLKTQIDVIHPSLVVALGGASVASGARTCCNGPAEKRRHALG